jgi:hypothetical protein
MLHTDARSEIARTGQSYEAPPSRDRLPTLPEDLSEYAWIHTGPPSWSDIRPCTGELASYTQNDCEPSASDDVDAGALVQPLPR